MSARQFSARLDARVLDRLERRGARSGLNKSRLAERYIDEGIRIEDHPGIIFRDGPTGRGRASPAARTYGRLFRPFVPAGSSARRRWSLLRSGEASRSAR